MNFESSAIKTSTKVCNEMSRLSTKVIQTVPILWCHTLRDSHMTIALLNVGCLLNKLSDIINDVNMQGASVVCLCETWLSSSNHVPQIFDDHVISRCDRQHANNNRGEF